MVTDSILAEPTPHLAYHTASLSQWCLQTFIGGEIRLWNPREINITEPRQEYALEVSPSLLALDIFSFTMAEAIGLAASIFAIGGAADTAYKIQRKIRRLARDLGAAQENILKFATEIKDFSLVVSTANLSLHEYSKRSSAENKVLQHIQQHEVLHRIVKASDCVMDHIYKLMPRLKSLESSIPLVERWKWVLRRTEVEALGPKMESVKSGLQLIVTVVTLESVLNQGESPENKRLVSGPIVP
jgi:uncharacterized protein YoxC